MFACLFIQSNPSETSTIRELNAMRKLQGHKNIVLFYGTEKDFQPTASEERHLMMELGDTNLRHWGDSKPRRDLTEIECRQLTKQIVSGLKHMHSKGFMHRYALVHSAASNFLICSKERWYCILILYFDFFS